MRTGILVDPLGRSPFWRVKALGAGVISLPLVAGSIPTGYLEQARARGLDVLGVITRATFSDPVAWRLLAEADLLEVRDLVRRGLLTDVAVGHEPDDGWNGGLVSDDPLVVSRGGIRSWPLRFADLGELVHLAADALDGEARLWLGGLVSGHPEVLSVLDLGAVDGVLVHPYIAWPGPSGVPVLEAYLDGIAAEVAAQGHGDRIRLGIGELGRSDQASSRGAVADHLSESLAYLASRGDVDLCLVCCDSDLTISGYGMFDAAERPKPGVAVVYQAGQAARAAPGATPPGSQPPVESHVEPDDDEDPAWDDPVLPGCTKVAAILGLSADGADSLEPLWSRVTPFLELYGVEGDAAARVCLLAAIVAATGGRLTPLLEPIGYHVAEGAYGRDHGLGLLLGNRYYGDGFRYRGRGLLPIRGRDSYARFGQILGLDLLADPDLALEPAVALGIAATAFGERGLFEAAPRGELALIWRAIDPGLVGYDRFVAAAQALWASVDERAERAGTLPGDDVGGSFRRAYERVGDRYREGGDGVGGFDAPGLVAWAYRPTGQDLPPDADAIAERSAPIGPDEAVAGDVILYQYGEPSRGGATYAHVGLATERADLVLDARAGLGVGARPHPEGALRRYRRVLGPASTEEEVDDEMWKERFEDAMGAMRRLADTLDAERGSVLPQGAPSERPADSAVKAEHVEYGQRMWQWQQQANELAARHGEALATVAGDLRDLATPPGADRPEGG